MGPEQEYGSGTSFGRLGTGRMAATESNVKRDDGASSRYVTVPVTRFTTLITCRPTKQGELVELVRGGWGAEAI